MACSFCSGRGRKVKHDGSLEYYSQFDPGSIVTQLMQAIMPEMARFYSKSSQDSQRSGSSAHGQLKILKYPSTNTVLIWDPYNFRYEKLRDYGYMEVLTGNTANLGEFFQRFGGSRRGLIDYNMLGPQLPGQGNTASSV